MVNLEHIFIRGQHNGKWRTVSCYDATDEEFDRWAHLKVPIENNEGKTGWTLDERSEFIEFLRSIGVIVYEVGDIDADRREIH